MANIIDGRSVAKKLNAETKNEVIELNNKGIYPCLAVILVGTDQASQRYVRSKHKKAEELGIKSIVNLMDESTSQEELLKVIEQYNQDDSINGILVQSPLPKHIDENVVIDTINPKKDVDGFHPVNVGNLFLNKNINYPVACTPKGVMTLLDYYNIDLDGAKVVVVGRSSIVGKPMLSLLINANATVTVVHSHTKNMQEYTKDADVLISAVGKANLIDETYLKDEAVVIDVGQNLDENGKLCGDVNYEDVQTKASLITPVPGGVGPMTIATLMQQTVELTKWYKDDEISD
ncbi:bifunctional methylenetetrahydrofolate dehydrogenase/methenyltetrahydrofolate cyclohydrolase [Lactobacillus sp. S2-2]|uniref:bifunctional 5,10-methylenetetrahydrofolate dehydrogenase/5,10-methenyltetrahydrofolate cyclohydrolase n=1 Tax=Lactobacillus sp. S2-2 TaxID=2692917 RepID=UPI001F44BA15|nr:tetrahydrofolate dehydrogenase/cyclohydrolase catalytic domain-containing protein [Lactobacillus sp. S2-2]MCF6515110.1 bifunctional methylenetetrahydrofolate dehydrogenase/methenyltetrahydrofolate cyclohydrolase [Lactobacillus sp. S2-2]